MNTALTEKQTQVLKFLWAYWQINYVLPTRQEICDFFKFKSPNAAEDHLRALARKGAIKLVPGKSRGIRFLTAPPKQLRNDTVC